MPFYLFTGTYHVTNSSPDGDSIKFKPDDPDQMARTISGTKIRRGRCQLRVEAIDTLETHYNAGGAFRHQPMDLALEGMDGLLNGLGITQVKWDASHSRVVSAKDGIPGYLLTRQADGYGRPVAFVYAGAAPSVNGSSVHLDVAQMRQSVNVHLLQTGLAYPTFYTGFYADLRRECAQIARDARERGLGVWARDVTLAGFTARAMTDITDSLVLLPKLFRRLAAFFGEGGSDLAAFHASLSKDRVIRADVPFGHAEGWDNFFDLNHGQLSLKTPPEDLIFEP